MCQRPCISETLPRATNAAAGPEGSRAAVGKLPEKGQIGNILGFVGHVQYLLHILLFIFFYNL